MPILKDNTLNGFDIPFGLLIGFGSLRHKGVLEIGVGCENDAGLLPF